MTFDACSPDAHKLIDLESAIRKIREEIRPVNEFELLPLKAALGRILKDTLHCSINLPTERNSAMDGYAFRSQDLLEKQSLQFKLVGTSWAGKPFNGKVQTGECIRIFTGAVLPDQTDSVIIQEQVIQVDDYITIPEDASPCQNVRNIGEDLKFGDELLSAGKKLTPADLSLLAATGVKNIKVIRPLRIAYCSTGDELIPLGQPIRNGKIYDSNRYLLYALLQDPAFCLTDLGVIPDNPDLLTHTLTHAAEQHDVIITTGGVSVGEADHVKNVLMECGEIRFWKIAIKPGKPLAFGTIGASYFFGLPGNPVAVTITLEKIVRPALERLCGQPLSVPLKINAICSSKLKKAPGRMEFQRGILKRNTHGEFEVKSAGMQGSHVLSSFCQANCYIVLDATCTGVNPGEQVTVEPFSTSFIA